MKRSLGDWTSGVTRFLTGSPGIAPGAPLQRRREPGNEEKVEEPLDSTERDAVEAIPGTQKDRPLGTEEAMAASARAQQTDAEAAPAEALQPSADMGEQQTITPLPEAQPIERVLLLVADQSRVLRQIQEDTTALQSCHRLIEEQDALVKDLTTRCRHAEEREMTDAVSAPFLAETIQVFDTVWKARRDWTQERPPDPDAWIRECLEAVESEILSMLERHGVSMLRDTTTLLNPAKQRVVGTQTPRLTRDGEVVSVVRPGFSRNGRVERPEEVVVARTTQGGVTR
jgi:molecular chaperone GrpE (heat shock protein)